MSRITRLLLLQALILLGGIAFSWSKLLPQFQNFLRTYGTIFRFRDCIIPNPLATACFYGSLAFVIALIWAAFLLRSPQASRQRFLKNFLLSGVFFAGAVVSYEIIDFYELLPTGGVTISCTPSASPLYSPCLIGFIIFFIAFLTARKTYHRLRSFVQ